MRTRPAGMMMAAMTLLLMMMALVGCSRSDALEDIGAVHAELQASHAPSRAAAFDVHGAVLEGEVYVFLNVLRGRVDEVVYYLDDPGGESAAIGLATAAPFHLTGDDGPPLDTRELEPGQHSLHARIVPERGRVSYVEAQFTVLHDESGEPASDPGSEDPDDTGSSSDGDGEGTSGGQPSTGGDSGDEGEEPGGDDPDGEEPGGDEPGGDEPGGNESGGDDPGDDDSGGDESDDPGDDEPGDDEPGDTDSGDDPGGDDPGDETGDEPGDEPGDDETSDPGTSIWQPEPGTSWQWQLSGRLDTSVDADVYDIDLFDVSASTIRSLQDSGRKVICYFSAGTYESWRPDADDFPDAVIGAPMDEWDEEWLDIRRLDLLGPIMTNRLDLAAEKGCDAVEPDNVDGYANDTGLPLDYDDQIRYNTFLSEEAHARGLAIGLKNDLGQVRDLVDHFDFAVNEECYQWRECEALSPFVEAGKAVFGAEYGVSTSEFCPVTNALNFDFILKNLHLDAYRESCR